jgi:hypothetical protein
MSEDTATVDLLEKDREYNSNRSTIDSRKERDWMQQEKERLRNTESPDLTPEERASRWARKASMHLEEPIGQLDILKQMDGWK